MNKQEVVKLLTLIKANYPNYNKDLTAEEGGLLIDFWVDLFGEYDLQIVGAGLQAFIAKDTKGFAPVRAVVFYQHVSGT